MYDHQIWHGYAESPDDDYDIFSWNCHNLSALQIDMTISGDWFRKRQQYPSYGDLGGIKLSPGGGWLLGGDNLGPDFQANNDYSKYGPYYDLIDQVRGPPQADDDSGHIFS